MDPAIKEGMKQMGIGAWYTWEAAKSLLELEIMSALLMLSALIYGLAPLLRGKPGEPS